jgi:thiamine biosynthesis protein ThiI
MVKRSVVIHYHEISLKRNNRGWFENCLHRHLTALLRGFEYAGIRRFAGRMFIDLAAGSPIGPMSERLKTAFGIANFAVARRVPADMEAIRSGAAEEVAGRHFASFRVEARRGTKDFPLNSQQIAVDLGAHLRAATGAAVRMDDPELTCFVEIVGSDAYLYFERIAGGGGLPARSGGRLMALLSGGIDSPVAAYRMMRRGCRVAYVHFHSFPHTTAESQEKVRSILRILSRYQENSRLYLVPFCDLQRELVAYTPAPLRVILYRRFMVRIAETLSGRERASALVTGDSLGQVASQTLENLSVVSAATRLPIFRPLIGDDKEDIIALARRIGTYDISILPDQDCCTLFVPKHPETMARLEEVEAVEKGLEVGRLVDTAVAATLRETVDADFSAVAAAVS